MITTRPTTDPPADLTALAAHVEAIYRAEEHAKPVRRADEVPASYDAITPEWLTAILCRGIGDARVTAHHVTDRDDGSSNRARIRLEYNSEGRAAGLPTTLFGKLTESMQSRIMLGICGAGEAEVQFYNRARPRLDIEAPISVYAGYDPANYNSFILLRDLGRDIHICDDLTDMTWDRAVSQVDTLARLHSQFFESPELGSQRLPFRTWYDWWTGYMTASPQFAVSCDRAFGLCEDLMSPQLFRRRKDIWPATDKCVARHLQLPQSLTHGDVHLRNWYLTPSDQMALTDWQSATIGHWSRDYAYAVTTALTIENRRKWEQELLRVYLDKMAERGVPRASLEEAWLNYRQQLFTVLAFWTITLCPSPDMPEDLQPPRTTREFLRRILAAIEDHDALESFD